MCGHTSVKPWPIDCGQDIEEGAHEEKAQKEQEEKKQCESLQGSVLCLHYADRCVADVSCCIAFEDFLCFHRHVTWQEDIIGVGLSPLHSPEGKLLSADICLDFISYSAYKHDNVKSGAWGQPFQLFLPLVGQRICWINSHD